MYVPNRAIKNDCKQVERAMLAFIPQSYNENGEIDRFLRDVEDWDESVPGYNKDGYELHFLVLNFLQMYKDIYSEDSNHE